MTKFVTEPKRATYTFKVVVEPDDDVWHAYCPALEAVAPRRGARRGRKRFSTSEVVEMVVAGLREDGEAIPDEAQTAEEPRIAVTV